MKFIDFDSLCLSFANRVASLEKDTSTANLARLRKHAQNRLAWYLYDSKGNNYRNIPDPDEDKLQFGSFCIRKVARAKLAMERVTMQNPTPITDEMIDAKIATLIAKLGMPQNVLQREFAGYRTKKYYEKSVVYNDATFKAALVAGKRDFAYCSFYSITSENLTSISGCNFTGSELFNCNLTGVQANSVKFNSAKLRGCIFTNMNFSGSAFNKSTLSSVSFQSCTFETVQFAESKIKDGIFQTPTFGTVSFKKSILEVSFRNCNISNLDRVNFNGARMKGSIMTDLNSANVNPEILKAKVICNNFTRWWD
jgi:uncharacterized protein YjbI with pentapeptide repeats